MMLFEFQLLSLDEKLDILYREGVYVGKYKEEGLWTILYQLDYFYVEVIYRQYRRYIKRIYCFTSTSLLDPYLEGIEIELLVS